MVCVALVAILGNLGIKIDLPYSDETLRTSASLSLGNRLLEYRDLSAWRVQIPEVKTTGNAGNGTGKKVFFTFTIEVQRIDITSRQENAEDLQWTVQRKYSEFYTLESKLTEFHGTFEDLHLPAKASLFTGKGLDVMHANRLPFQDYLTGLLKKPFLRESDILFTFLTSPEEFTLASSTFGVGRIINKVNPMKLTMAKERGQNLQPFIDSFVASTLSPAPKPRLLSSHCSKSSFFVQKFNFDFPRKLSIFWGEKLMKMLWFWTF